MTDPHQQPRHESFWEEDHYTPRWAKAVAALIVVAGVIAAIAIYTSRNSSDSTTVAQTGGTHVVRKAAAQAKPKRVDHSASRQRSLPPASKGVPSASTAGFLSANADASFQSLASSLAARVGLAVQPLGGGPIREFGDLREGHAWSSIKVPILATLLREQGESLDAEEEALASSAITASDNEAAAALFGRIEDRRGGLAGASQAVEGTLHEAGSTSTVVATAPPPAGAVSTYGQTVWTLADAVRFFAALGRCEVVGASGTARVESLMESVIPEQRWGLGEAEFPSGWRVAMKGGWGPEAESEGAYLVRQSGLVQSARGGIAVAMIAMDDSGTYPAGAADLTRLAQWLAGELKGLGPVYRGCAG